MAWVLLPISVLRPRQLLAFLVPALASCTAASAASITLDYTERNSYRHVHVGEVVGGIFTPVSDSLSSSDPAFSSSAALSSGDASATASVSSFADWLLGVDSLAVSAAVTANSSTAALPPYAAVAAAGTDVLLDITVTGTWSYSFSGYVTGSQFRYAGTDGHYAYQTGAGFVSLFDYVHGTVFDFPTPSDGSPVAFAASGTLTTGTYALNVSAIALSQVFDYADATSATGGVFFNFGMEALPDTAPVPDRSATAGVLALSLAGLFVARRRRK